LLAQLTIIGGLLAEAKQLIGGGHLLLTGSRASFGHPEKQDEVAFALRQQEAIVISQ
jgi:hypothetical protein